MRHRKHSVRFGRQKSHYKATMRHLVSGLVINKSIATTKTKAKETSRLADRLVTIGKKNTVSNQRRAYEILQDRDLVSMLFKEIAPLFKDRNGGYTRVMLTGKRRGDNAQMAILEFVEKPKPKTEITKKKDKQKKETVQPDVKPRPEKKEEPKKVKPKKKEETLPKKEEPKKIAPPLAPKEPEKPREAKSKPGFFKRLFGRKKEG